MTDAEVLIVDDDAAAAAEEALALVQQQLSLTLDRSYYEADEIEQKIAGLRHLHQELTTLLSSWQDCGGRKPSAI